MSLNDEVYDTHTQAMLSHINVGTGKDIKISELAEIMKEVVGFKGKLFTKQKCRTEHRESF